MEWQCVGHNPTKWGSGKRDGEFLQDIIAVVERNKNGTWSWRVKLDGDTAFGIEPSRETAISMVFGQVYEREVWK